MLAADALWQRPETRAPLVDWLIDHTVPDDAATMRLLLDALRGRDDPSEEDAQEIVAAATAARSDLAADAAATRRGLLHEAPGPARRGVVRFRCRNRHRNRPRGRRRHLRASAARERIPTGQKRVGLR